MGEVGSGEGQAGAAALGLSLSRISARRVPGSATVRFSAEVLGGYLRLRRSGGAARTGGGLRGEVAGWSRESRRRLFRGLVRTDFAAWPGGLSFATLTYPGDWRAAACDGPTAHRQLRALRARVEREFGQVRACWKLEFQRRGAPHWHLVVGGPDPLALRAFLRPAWYGVVGSGDVRHLAAGVECDAVRSSEVVARYCAGYLGARRKTYQEQVPPDWRAGRWWGWWRWRPPVPDDVPLSRREYWGIRRLLRRMTGSRRVGWTVAHTDWRRVIECVR